MATLVERTSRYTVPVALPAGRRDATTTANALIGSVTEMPAQLVKTLTWDQGSEMAAHAAITLATTVEVYFAHPHSPAEPGTNENTNGLLREYAPLVAPRSPTTRPTSTSWPASSTTDHAVSSATEPQQKSSPTSWPARLLPPDDTAPH